MKTSNSLPRSLEPYREDFEDILRVVELSSGFVLLPIALPGPDLGRGLAHCLRESGYAPCVFTPENADAWKNLATELVSAKFENHDVVIVNANSDLPENLPLALRLVNERRDAIAKHLNCPLLWCGSADFLVQTGQLAPDFWSIRAVERRIEARARPESQGESVERKSEKAELLDEAIRQGDRKSTEILFLARLREIMAKGGHDDFMQVLATIPKELEEIDPPFGFELTLMKAEMARRHGNIADALKLLDGLTGKTKTPDDICRLDLLRGRVWEKAGDWKQAEAAYGRAHENKDVADDGWAMLAAEYYERGLRRMGFSWNNDVAQRRTLHSARAGVAIRALHQAILAEMTGREHDLRKAKRLLHEAIALHEKSKDQPTLLFGGEVAEAIQEAQRAIQEAQATFGATDMLASRSPTKWKQWFERNRAQIGSGLLLLGVLLMIVNIVIAMVTWSTTGGFKQVYCFQGPAPDKEITCAESLEQCEKMRATVGATGPCLKPSFTPARD